MKKPRFHNILVPVDFSELTSIALQTAERIAKRFDSTIHLANVEIYSYPAASFAPMAPVPAGAFGDLEERRSAAEIALKRLAQQHDLKGTCRVEIGSSPFDVICWIARQIPADLIVTSTHGYTGAKHLFLGSTAERLVQHSACPVLVARERRWTVGDLKLPSGVGRILVPIDFSPCSMLGLQYAIGLADKLGAEIVVLHALDMGYAYTADGFAMYDLSALEEKARRAAVEEMVNVVGEAKFGTVTHEFKVKMGRPVETICDFAAKENIDLIVTSTHGYTGFKHVLIGSVAERTVRLAPCPVLVVPSHPEVRRGQRAGQTRLGKPAPKRIISLDPKIPRLGVNRRTTKKTRKITMHPFPERRLTNKFRQSHRASGKGAMP